MTTRSRPAVLGLGTATFLQAYGFGQRERPGVALLRRAIESGVRYLDTASAYGESESSIAHLAAECAERGVRIATKIAGALDPERMEASARASLERLHMDSVDTLLLHSASESDLRSPSAAAAWTNIRRARLASRVGASTYGVTAASLALDAPWCDAVQVEYSILNQSVVRAVSPLRRDGQELIVRSVLCKGLLTTGALSASLAEPVAGRIGAIAELAREWGMSLPALAIRFALDTPGVDIVLVGVASAAELDEALAAAALPPLSPEQHAAAAAFDAAGEDWTHPERWTESVS